jgi:hypothetical protein
MLKVTAAAYDSGPLHVGSTKVSSDHQSVVCLLVGENYFMQQRERQAGGRCVAVSVE